jgi:signal peptidase I
MVYWFIDIKEMYNYTIERRWLLGRNSTRGKQTAGKAILVAFFVSLVMKFFVLDFMIAEGNSMLPSIKPGAILPVCKVIYGIRLPGSLRFVLQWGVPREGDVIVFYTPMQEIAVKRCGENFMDDMFYVFGDNISQSFDSRNYGPVPKNYIIGRVLGVK